jgi:hypothetical protein
MPRTITTTMERQRRGLWSDAALVWLVEIRCGAGAGGNGVFRLAKSREHVSAGGHVWQAASIPELLLPGESGDGSLGQTVVTIGDVSRIAAAYVELDAGDGSGWIFGRPLSVYLVSEADLANPVAVIKDAPIVRATVGERSVRLTAGVGIEGMVVPWPVYDRANFPQLLPSGGGAGLAGGGGA